MPNQTVERCRGLPLRPLLFSKRTPLSRVAAAGFSVRAAPFVVFNAGYFLTV